MYAAYGLNTLRNSVPVHDEGLTIAPYAPKEIAEKPQPKPKPVMKIGHVRVAKPYTGNTMPDWVCKIAEEIAAKHGMDLPAMLGPSCKPPFARARQELFYILRTTPMPTIGLTASYLQIAAWCNRDKKAVIYGVEKHAARHNLPLIKQRAGRSQ